MEAEDKMAGNEGERQPGGACTVRLFSPLKGWFYDAEGYCTELSGGALYGYDREIQKALGEDWIQREEGGLAKYLPEGPLKEKVARMYPSIDIWLCSAWGVLTVECTQELLAEEVRELKQEWLGQMNDGWGEGFAQQGIDCGFGSRLYVDFDTFSQDKIRTEQELKVGRHQELPIGEEAPKMGMA